ncbi:uncharacterized protein [Elaeis guineensis]|uniref:uncharacterized protein isoform X2 n=1 Tax=Elaeis guineensis var. tenera TaxID=51953 RepID=UPI003C6D084F
MTRCGRGRNREQNPYFEETKGRSEGLRTYSRSCMKLNGNPSLRLQESSMNIATLMTWLPTHLRVKVAMYGLARIMMETYRSDSRPVAEH